MKNYFTLFLLLIVAMAFTSCATNQYTYQPKLRLDVSPKTINKTVRIEKFRDTSPEEEKASPLFGISVTSKNVMLGSLDTEVTKAIALDFTENMVFKVVSRNAENPDYVIKGEIKRFKGLTKENNVYKITSFITWGLCFAGLVNYNPAIYGAALFLALSPLLGYPIRTNLSEIEIVITIYDKDNNLVGTYTAGASSKSSSNAYNSKPQYFTNQMNATFEDVVMQLREQIISQLAISN